MGDEPKHEFDYDYLVIGGGSGGIASAKRAAAYGAKVALVEMERLGGTCVNVGCVPKKVMWNAASVAEVLETDADQYGFRQGNGATDRAKWNLDMALLKRKRDAYVAKLNGIYRSGLSKLGVKVLHGCASFVDGHTVSVVPSETSTKEEALLEPVVVTSAHVLIAVGGRPLIPPGLDRSLCWSSDDFFTRMDTLPKTVAVVGGGYIAVELAGLLRALGCETHLVLRKERALRTFDPMLVEGLDAEMARQGMIVYRNTGGVASLTREGNLSTTTTPTTPKTTVTFVNGDSLYGMEAVIMAVGRVPNVDSLNLEAAGVELTANGKGYVKVDAYGNTTASHVYALGDVCGVVELTPMAIAAGRRLGDRLFGGNGKAYPHAHVSYHDVPTVVFSHPTIGTVGLTEPEARARYGDNAVQIYTSTFSNLYYGIFTDGHDDAEDDSATFSWATDTKPKTLMKLVCVGPDEKVVGLHILGRAADEILQGFGVALKMGATKADFDSCIAIHPTAAEELVTMGTWGTSPQATGAKDNAHLTRDRPPPPPSAASTTEATVSKI